MSIAIRYFSHIERDMRNFLEILRSSRFPMDKCYFHTEENAYVLKSHPFIDKNDAIEYASYLEQLFRRGRATIQTEGENRHILYYNPDEIYEDDLKDFMQSYGMGLFHPEEGYFDNQSENDAYYLLKALNKTQLPMDAVYWNHKNNSFYLVSHSFSKTLQPEARNFCDIFQSAFGQESACVNQDFIGRSFVTLDPRVIHKERFQEFVQDHYREVFEGREKRRNHGTNVLSCFFKNQEEDARKVFESLRKSQYPMEASLFDETHEHYYLVSPMYTSKENAEAHLSVYRQFFGKLAAVLHEDIEKRYYLYLDPSQVQINALKHYLEKYPSKLFRSSY